MMQKKSFYWFKNMDNYAMLPKSLLTNPKYKNLKSDEIVLYSLMVDRMNLSATNEYFNDPKYGVYVYYTIEEIESMLKCCNSKAEKVLKNLVDAGLLIKKNQGQGRPSKLIPREYEEYKPKTGDNPITQSGMN